MTAPSEQEWRDAVFDAAAAFVSNQVIRQIHAAIRPLRERERQQARQEALPQVALTLLEASKRALAAMRYPEGNRDFRHAASRLDSAVTRFENYLAAGGVA